MAKVFSLDLTVLDLVGSDAAAILHNLTTNDVRALAVGQDCETFLTDVRGKTLAHVQAFRIEEGYRLVGAAGQAEAIAAHADRYTIREDATPVDRSKEWKALVIHPEAADDLRAATDQVEFCGETDWLGEKTFVAIGNDLKSIIGQLGEQEIGTEADFHHARTLAGFPWYGIDLSEKNLPQEATRIEQSICFTKGCYLGQETVARLDALGQVQKQLVQWTTRGAIPTLGAEVVSADDKVVGRLTSVAVTGDDTAVAIGIARRSHFDAGSTATGEGFEATVS